MGPRAARIRRNAIGVVAALVLAAGCGGQSRPAAGPTSGTTTGSGTPSASSTPSTSPSVDFTPAPVPDPGPARRYPACTAAHADYTGLRAAGLRLAHQGRMPRSASQGVAAARLVVANARCFPAAQVKLARSFRPASLNLVPAGVIAQRPRCRQPYLDILHLLQFSAGIATSSARGVDLSDGIDAIDQRNPGCFGAGDVADMKQALLQQKQY